MYMYKGAYLLYAIISPLHSELQFLKKLNKKEKNLLIVSQYESPYPKSAYVVVLLSFILSFVETLSVDKRRCGFSR